MRDKKYFNKSFLKLKVNANRHKNFDNGLIRTREKLFYFFLDFDEN